MRKEFLQHFGRVTGIKSGILREAYRRLTTDSSAPNTLSESEVDERIRKALDDEDPDLIWDLRIINNGRPDEYKVFLNKCQELAQGRIETAVDDRRHDSVDESGETAVHLAMAMSAPRLAWAGEESVPSGHSNSFRAVAACAVLANSLIRSCTQAYWACESEDDGCS